MSYYMSSVLSLALFHVLTSLLFGIHLPINIVIFVSSVFFFLSGTTIMVMVFLIINGLEFDEMNYL